VDVIRPQLTARHTVPRQDEISGDCQRVARKLVVDPAQHQGRLARRRALYSAHKPDECPMQSAASNGTIVGE